MPEQEYRTDGWPLCPRCGEDELDSVEMMGWRGDTPRPSLERCYRAEFCCYRCAYGGLVAPPPPQGSHEVGWHGRGEAAP